ncbi:MAG: hypothetical protein ABIB71_02860 [Candidatus Woesearchaeota archaeon]
MLELYDAFDEYKRVDHLIHVTLKYTRTVDIIRNVLTRLVSTIDLEIQAVMEWAKKEGKISFIPPVPLVRCQNIENIFPKDKTVKDLVDFYCSLRKIVNSEYKKREEYRKNVALVTKDVEVNIETLKDYAEKTKNFITYIDSLMKQ